MRNAPSTLLLVAAVACGWTIGSAAVVALHRHAMPLPKAERPKTRVMIDRTTSQVPLAKGAFNEDRQGRGFGLLEQWIARLGCITQRASGDESFGGEALVVICPEGPVDAKFRDRLVRYVDDGGRLLVIDSGDGGPSTADDLLSPFGLSVRSSPSMTGVLTAAGPWPGLQVEHAAEVSGGQRIASLDGGPAVAATIRHGKGLVMAIGFGSLFNDARMGNQWWHYPDETERTRYEFLFSLLRCVLEDKPVAKPAVGSGQPAAPKSPPPASRRLMHPGRK